MPTPVPLPIENLKALAEFEAAYATGNFPLMSKRKSVLMKRHFTAVPEAASAGQGGGGGQPGRPGSPAASRPSSGGSSAPRPGSSAPRPGSQPAASRPGGGGQAAGAFPSQRWAKLSCYSYLASIFTLNFIQTDPEVAAEVETLARSQDTVIRWTPNIRWNYGRKY